MCACKIISSLRVAYPQRIFHQHIINYCACQKIILFLWMADALKRHLVSISTITDEEKPLFSARTSRKLQRHVFAGHDLYAGCNKIVRSSYSRRPASSLKCRALGHSHFSPNRSAQSRKISGKGQDIAQCEPRTLELKKMCVKCEQKSCSLS